MSFDEPTNYPHPGIVIMGKMSPEEVTYLQEQFAEAMERLGKHYCILFDERKLVGGWFVNPESGRAWARELLAKYPNEGIKYASKKSTTEAEDLTWAQGIFEQHQTVTTRMEVASRIATRDPLGMQASPKGGVIKPRSKAPPHSNDSDLSRALSRALDAIARASAKPKRRQLRRAEVFATFAEELEKELIKARGTN